MAITQTEIMELCVSMFDAAPGATYLAEIEAMNASTTTELATILGGLDIFTSQFTGNTDAETAAAILGNFNIDPTSAAGIEALAWVTANQATMTTAEIMAAAHAYLSGDSVDAAFADAAAVLTNKAAAAAYYSVDLGLSGSDLATLQATVASVDETAASVTTANAAQDAVVLASATTANIATLTAANAALTAFLVTADGDDDAATTAAAGDAAIAATAATAAVDVLIANDSTYINGSTAVQAALLADKTTTLASTLTVATATATAATAAIAAVDGLAEAVTALTAADAAETAAIAAEAAAVIVEGTEDAAWAFASDAQANISTSTNTAGVLTVATGAGAEIASKTVTLTVVDGTTGVVSLLTDTATVIDGVALTLATATADQLTEYATLQATAADYIVAINANVAADAANTAAAAAVAASTAVDVLDLDAAARADLLLIGAEIETDGGAVASVSTPTDAEIATHTALLVTEHTAAVAALVTAIGAVAFDTDEGTTATAMTVITDAAEAAGTISTQDNTDIIAAYTTPVVTNSTESDAARALAVTAIATNNTDAATVVFDGLIADYATSAAANNDLLDASTTADAAVVTAQDAVDALAAAAATEVAADALAAEEVVLQAAITAANATFTDAGQTAPVTIDGAEAGTSAADLFIVDAATDGAVAISAFGTAGADTIYFGSDFTLNTGAITTGDNSTLEYWATEVAGAAVYTFETSTFGSNAGTAETLVVTLTGVALADTTVVDGYVTLV